jgi:hypothetical protein
MKSLSYVCAHHYHHIVLQFLNQKARTSTVRAFNPGKPELENLVSFCPDDI